MKFGNIIFCSENKTAPLPYKLNDHSLHKWCLKIICLSICMYIVFLMIKFKQIIIYNHIYMTLLFVKMSVILPNIDISPWTLGSISITVCTSKEPHRTVCKGNIKINIKCFVQSNQKSAVILAKFPLTADITPLEVLSR